MTEVDAVTSHAVHDELARLLVQYIKNQPREENRKFLNVRLREWESREERDGWMCEVEEEGR